MFYNYVDLTLGLDLSHLLCIDIEHRTDQNKLESQMKKTKHLAKSCCKN